MKPAFKTETNAVYFILTHKYAKLGKAEPTLEQFKAEWSLHQNRRGWVFQKRM